MDNEARFRAIYELHHAAVRRYALHRGLSASDADDLVAETFTVAWRRLDKVPVDDPLPWLYAVARNHWRNGLRREARSRKLLARLGPPDDAGTVFPVTSEIGRAFTSLSESDRELLRLIAWDGLSPQQAASSLGCTPATARVRLHRARKRLAKALEETEHRRGTEQGQRTHEEVRDGT